MKWLAALLMIVNVVVYLWASGHQVTVNETAIISKPDVNKEGMLLLGENGNLKQFGNIAGYQPSASAFVELAQDQTKKPGSNEADLQDSQQTAANTDTQSQQSDSVPVENEDSTSSADATSAKTELKQATPRIIAQSCYRLGPFKKEESWQAAKKWMGQNGIEFRYVTSESRELQAVRVYLGPYSSILSTEPVVRRLKGKNLDHFVSLAENGSVRISLGYFAQQELAAKFLTHLQSIDIQAKSQLEYRQLGPFNWIVIAVDSVEQNRVTAHDWVEPTVGLSRVNC